MKQNKIYSLLGLAMRGRNLVSGEFQTEDAVKKGSAMLVIVAEDADHLGGILLRLNPNLLEKVKAT